MSNDTNYLNDEKCAIKDLNILYHVPVYKRKERDDMNLDIALFYDVRTESHR